MIICQFKAYILKIFTIWPLTHAEALKHIEIDFFLVLFLGRFVENSLALFVRRMIALTQTIAIFQENGM